LKSVGKIMKNLMSLDDTLRKDAGCATEMDYVEQSFGDEKVKMISSHLKIEKAVKSSGINFLLLDLRFTHEVQHGLRIHETPHVAS